MKRKRKNITATAPISLSLPMMCWHMSPSAIPRKKILTAFWYKKTSRFLSETRVCWFCFVWNWLQNASRRQNKKFFDPTIFQKCWWGVGEQPTFAEQIKLHNEMKQKSKNESEESQLPSNQKGCNERQGFRGNCDSQGKLGMCPSLAEPDLSGVPRTSRRQPKVFWSSNFWKTAAPKNFFVRLWLAFYYAL